MTLDIYTFQNSDTMKQTNNMFSFICVILTSLYDKMNLIVFMSDLLWLVLVQVSFGLYTLGRSPK